MTIPPRDMTATFGSTLQQPLQVSFQNERFNNQVFLPIRGQSPPLQVKAEKTQSILIDLAKQAQTGSAGNLNGKSNEANIMNENELVEVYE